MIIIIFKLVSVEFSPSNVILNASGVQNNKEKNRNQKPEGYRTHYKHLGQQVYTVCYKFKNGIANYMFVDFHQTNLHSLRPPFV